ncbi:hypothetical protein RLOC_00014716 [Lonchura striata]|uniref:Uncharacterized protein n=1 Tax=Lonchura striata TaxID=40157 RepID=A0A218U732_9PASE|nr:hypothetical protein RLOC_00014716 [Lonchura striata domestica]
MSCGPNLLLLPHSASLLPSSSSPSTAQIPARRRLPQRGLRLLSQPERPCRGTGHPSGTNPVLQPTRGDPPAMLPRRGSDDLVPGPPAAPPGQGEAPVQEGPGDIWGQYQCWETAAAHAHPALAAAEEVFVHSALGQAILRRDFP